MNLSNFRQRPLFKKNQTAATSRNKFGLFNPISRQGNYSQYFTSTQHTITSSPYSNNINYEKNLWKHIQTEPQDIYTQQRNYNDEYRLPLDRKLKTQDIFYNACQVSWGKQQSSNQDSFQNYTHRQSLERKFIQSNKENIQQFYQPQYALQKPKHHSKIRNIPHRNIQQQKTHENNTTKHPRNSYRRGRHNLSTTSYHSRPTLAPSDKNNRNSTKNTLMPNQRIQSNILQLQLKIQQQNLEQERAFQNLEKIEKYYENAKIERYQQCRKQLRIVERRVQKQEERNQWKINKIKQCVKNIVKNLSENVDLKEEQKRLLKFRQMLALEMYSRYPQGLPITKSNTSNTQQNSQNPPKQIISSNLQFPSEFQRDSNSHSQQQNNKTKQNPQKSINIQGVQIINQSSFYENNNLKQSKINSEQSEQQQQYQLEENMEKQSQSILLDDSIFG